MKHSYFENLILDAKPIGSEELLLLQAHCSTCKKCQRLQAGWKAILPVIESQVPVEPRPGFAHRWISTLDRRSELQKRRSVKSIIWSLAGTAVLCLLVFFVMNLSAGSASVFAQNAARFTADTSHLGTQVKNFLFIAIDKIPSSIWLIMLISFLGWISIGGLLWYVSAQNKRKKRLQYEVDR